MREIIYLSLHCHHQNDSCIFDINPIIYSVLKGKRIGPEGTFGREESEEQKKKDWKKKASQLQLQYMNYYVTHMKKGVEPFTRILTLLQAMGGVFLYFMTNAYQEERCRKAMLGVRNN